MSRRRRSAPNRSTDPLTAIFRLLGMIFTRGGRAGRAVTLGPAVLAVLTFGWYLFQPAERKEDINRMVGNYAEGRKNVRLTELLWDIWSLYFARDFIPTRVPANVGEIIYGGEPQRAALRHDVRTLYNDAYAVGYCDALANPVWAAYRVFDLKEARRRAERPDSFEVDPRTAARVEPGDYTGSGYDRGHLVPNHAIGTRFGPRAQEQTFLMSNICPQRHRLNAGVWKELEMKVAENYTGRYGQIWVLAGPVFGAEDRLPRLRGKVPVPGAFYLIVVQPHEGGVRVLPFLVDQEAPENAQPERYLTSVAEIERRTGLNFFPQLEAQAQAKLEAAKPSGIW